MTTGTEAIRRVENNGRTTLVGTPPNLRCAYRTDGESRAASRAGYNVTLSIAAENSARRSTQVSLVRAFVDVAKEAGRGCEQVVGGPGNGVEIDICK